MALSTLDRLQATIPADLDAQSVANEWFNAFAVTVEKKDASAVSELFLEDAFWRDMVALTWSSGHSRAADNHQILVCDFGRIGFSKLTLRLNSVALQPMRPRPRVNSRSL